MNLTNFIVTVVSAMGVWTVFQWFYRGYRVDLLKDRLFAIRDDLFDLARHGRVSFENPAYCMLRTTLNGFLQEGPKLGIVTIAMSGRRVSEEQVDSFRDRWAVAMDELRPSEQEELVRLRDRMNFVILDHVVFSSFAMTMTILPVLLWLLLHRIGKSAVTSLRRLTVQWIDRLDSTAMAVGEV